MNEYRYENDEQSGSIYTDIRTSHIQSYPSEHHLGHLHVRVEDRREARTPIRLQHADICILKSERGVGLGVHEGDDLCHLGGGTVGLAENFQLNASDFRRSKTVLAACEANDASGSMPACITPLSELLEETGAKTPRNYDHSNGESSYHV